MAQLPNADKAVIPIEKLRDYSLDPAHPLGKHKARVFRSALGFTQPDAPHLQELIRQAILTSEAVEVAVNEHGTRYIVDFPTTSARRTIVVRTAWIIDAGETVPRLTSCYVKE
jgi:hypothetical protein